MATWTKRTPASGTTWTKKAWRWDMGTGFMGDTGFNMRGSDVFTKTTRSVTTWTKS